MAFKNRAITKIPDSKASKGTCSVIKEKLWGRWTNVDGAAISDGKSLAFVIRQAWIEILASSKTSCVILAVT